MTAAYSALAAIPHLNAIYAFEANRYSGRIQASGGTTSNDAWYVNGVGTLDIEGQRIIAMLASGYVANGNLTYLEAAVKGAEFCFLPGVWGANHDWAANNAYPPTYKDVFAKAMIIHAIGQVIMALKGLTLPTGYDARITALETNLQTAIRWLAVDPDTATFVDPLRSANENTRMFVIAAVRQGVALNLTPELAGYSRDLMDGFIARQQADGTFLEAGGFDPNYQAVTLGLMATYALCLTGTYMAPVPFTDRLGDGKAARDAIKASISLGCDKLLSAIAADGTLLVNPGTRTMITGYVNSGTPGPKGNGVCAMSINLYRAGYATKRDFDAPAQAWLTKGQILDHIP